MVISITNQWGIALRAIWRQCLMGGSVDVCLASEIIPVLLSSESSPTMCHAELFREATGGVVREDVGF